jgi:uncharacterized protein (TIGR03000 family)
VVPAPGGPAEKAPAPKPEPRQTLAPTKSKLVVEVPADAKLYIDDQLMKTASAKRVFNTPTLEPGQQYYYILKAEVVREGKTYSETKRVLVRAGQEIKAAFPELESEAIAKAESGSR